MGEATIRRELRTFARAIELLARAAAACGDQNLAGQSLEAHQRMARAAALIVSEGEKRIARIDRWQDFVTTVGIIGKPMKDIEEEVFRKTAERLGKSPTLIAKALHVSRGWVYRRFIALGIPFPGADRNSIPEP